LNQRDGLTLQAIDFEFLQDISVSAIMPRGLGTYLYFEDTHAAKPRSGV
jgi:hypothetical protein